MRTLFVAACLCVALDATAQYYPEIRTKGTVASNDAVVYADSSGRFVKSGGSLSAVPFPLASGLSVSNTAVGASNLASSASASAGSAAAYATNAMTEAVAAGTTGSVALVAVASTGSVLRAAIGTATGTVMDAVASTGTVLRTAIGTATGTVMDAVASTGTVLRTAIGAATNTAMGATASTGTVLRTAIGTATTTVMSAVAGTGTAARAYTVLAHNTNAAQQAALAGLTNMVSLTHSQAVERVYWIGSTNREVYTTNVIGAIGYGTVGAGGATVYAPVVGVYTGITASAPTPQFMDEFSSTWYVQWIYTNWFMSDGTARWVLDTGSEPSTTDPTGTYYPFGHAETGNPTFALNEAWAAIETYTTNLVADSVTNSLSSSSVSNLIAQVAALKSLAFSNGLAAADVGAVAVGDPVGTATNALVIASGAVITNGGASGRFVVDGPTTSRTFVATAQYDWYSLPLQSTFTTLGLQLTPGNQGYNLGWQAATYKSARWYWPFSGSATGYYVRTRWVLKLSEPARTYTVEMYPAFTNAYAAGNLVVTPADATQEGSTGWGVLILTNLFAIPATGKDWSHWDITNGSTDPGQTVTNYQVGLPEIKLIYP